MPGAAVPPEVHEAVSGGWFPPRGAILDIGCGEGRLAGWLAERGYEVVGIDYSAAAIARARALHSHVAGLSFQTIDICRKHPGQARFDALVDRSTLHLIEPGFLARYRNNVAAAVKPGGHFLLLHPIGPGGSSRSQERKRRRLVAGLKTLFEPVFEIERVTDTLALGGEFSGQPAARGVALWMVRRGE